QRRFERALADFLHVDERRQLNVGLDTAMLRAFAGYAIELADGHRQLPAGGVLRPAIERHEVLYRALAEGALAEDEAAVIILNGSGEDLRRGCAETIDQNGERAVVGGGGLRIVEDFETPCCVLQLHDRPVIDEEAGERGRLRQIASAVATQ